MFHFMGKFVEIFLPDYREKYSCSDKFSFGSDADIKSGILARHHLSYTDCSHLIQGGLSCGYFCNANTNTGVSCSLVDTKKCGQDNLSRLQLHVL